MAERLAVLGLSTCVPGPGVALAGDEGDGAQRPLSGRNSAVEDAVLTLDTLLAETHTAWRDIAAIAVLTGPGSFSGIRIGIATAQALAYSRGKPVIGIPTFDAIAFALPPSQVPATILFPARQSAWYAARVQRDGDAWTFLDPPVVVPNAEAASLVLRWSEGDTPSRLVAPQDAIDFWMGIAEGRDVEPVSGNCYPQAMDVARLGRRWLARASDDLAGLVPNYYADPRITAPKPRPAPRVNGRED